MFPRQGMLGALAAVLLTVCLAAPAAAADSNLRGQVQALSAEHGFKLFGAGRIEQSPAGPMRDSLAETLRALLADYNFVIIGDGAGGVRSLRVSGPKGPPPELSRKVAVNTVRRGSNHYLEARIKGIGGSALTMSMMLDTGASTVVLPASLMPKLGFGEADVREVTLQTANGETEGWTGVLKSVEIGNAFERNVAVAFIDDEKLGHKKLLGMSYLSRYVITIDDLANTVSLERRAD